MTEQEAKDYIVNECRATRCRYLTEDNECVEDGDCFEVKAMCIKALEKQIAKKPVKRSFIVPYEGINVCPSCKEPLPSSKEHHCKCGQKLDWGNEDAE